MVWYCVECGAPDAKFKCSKCKTHRYCSRECQRTAWKSGHKRMCRSNNDFHDETSFSKFMCTAVHPFLLSHQRLPNHEEGMAMRGRFCCHCFARVGIPPRKNKDVAMEEASTTAAATTAAATAAASTTATTAAEAAATTTGAPTTSAIPTPPTSESATTPAQTELFASELTQSSPDCLYTCSSCQLVQYCSAAHYARERAAHLPLCREMGLAHVLHREERNTLNRREVRSTVTWCEELLTRQARFPSSWGDYLTTRGMDVERWSHDNLLRASDNDDGGGTKRFQLAHESDKLSFPLTMLHSLDLLFSETGGPTSSLLLAPNIKGILIHVVGAETSETFVAALFREVALLLPWNYVVFIACIGPELNTMYNGKGPAPQPGVPFDIKFFASTYEAFVDPRGPVPEGMRPDDFDVFRGKPHMAILFNSGMHEHTGHWVPALNWLVQNDIPTLATSYTPQEADDDAAVIRLLGGRVCIEPRKNPFSSQLPRFDTALVQGTFRTNDSLWAFKGRRTGV